MALTQELEKLRSDLAVSAEGVSGVQYDGETRSLTFNLRFAPPKDRVVVRLSKEYVEQYPNGTASLQLDGKFHVVHVAQTLTLSVLARYVCDLTLYSHEDTNAGGMGAPTATAPGSEPMGDTTESWSIEPTLEYDNAAVTRGICSALRDDVARAEGKKLHPVLVDCAALGTARVSMKVPLQTKMSKAALDGYGLAVAPINVTVTVDRAQYIVNRGAITVQVGQPRHFDSGIFPPVCIQLSSILTKYAHQFAMKSNPGSGSALDQLLSLGYEEEAARTALVAAAGDGKSPSDLVSTACALLMSAVRNDDIKDGMDLPQGSADVVAASGAATTDKVKAYPVGGESLLLGLVEYLFQRVSSLPSFCVICDRPHVFKSSMAVPSVCSREVCSFQFRKLEVGRDMAESIAIQTGVVDLLVSIARAASKSIRWNLIFDPFPTLSHEGTVLDKDNIELLRKIFSKMPALDAITKSDSVNDLKARMGVGHPLCYPTFQWLLSSNKSHILKLDPQDQLMWMGTQHQYLFVSHSPDRENAFQMMAKKHGTKWAFHGSQPANWHSILRNGLRNASGTKLQVNGAAYGKGIYLSPAASTAFNYARISGRNSGDPEKKHREEEFIDVDTMHCVALCEVVNHELKESGNIWVMPHEQCVATRFLFVFTHGYSEGQNVNLTDKFKDQQLRKLVAQFA